MPEMQCKAGDGFELICKTAKITFRELMKELEGDSLAQARSARTQCAPPTQAPAPSRKIDPEWAHKRLDSMWDRATTIGADGWYRDIYARACRD